MKLLVVILFIFFTDSALACYSDADCQKNGNKYACLHADGSKGKGVCSVRKICTSNDDCEYGRACIGIKKDARCIDEIANPVCDVCKLSASTSDVFFTTVSASGAGTKIYYDKECLLSVQLPLGKFTYGQCQMNAISEGICHAIKLLRHTLGRYLMVIAVGSFGIVILTTGKVKVEFIWLILLAIFLIYMGNVLVDVLLKEYSATCS